MKKYLLIILSIFIFTTSIFSQNTTQKTSDEQTQISEENSQLFETMNDEQQTLQIHPVTGFPEIIDKPFLMFNEGVAFSQINRIEKQENRSNFVREDYLIGMFFAMQTENMQPLNSLLKVSAYYPFYHTFNGMQQFPKQLLLYSFDLFAAPIFQTDMWKYVRLKFATGLHYNYQLTDEYHMHYLGLGLLTGAELPLSKYWTIVLDGTFTYDYPNLGTNRKVQPFNYSWQYHLDLGFRFSKKNPNKYSYINSRTSN